MKTSEWGEGRTVSIVVPVRDRFDLILRCLRSIDAQTGITFACTVLDACSTDGTSDLIAEFVQDRPNFRYIREPDAGQSDALQKGLASAVGEYFCWLNADDYWEPGFLAAASAVLDADAAAVLVSGATIVEDANGRQLTTLQPGVLDSRTLLTRQTSIVQPSTLFRTKVVKHVGGVDRDLHYAMDYDLFIRLLGCGHMCVRDDVWAHFLLDSTTKSGSNGAGFVREQWTVRRRYGAPLGTRVNGEALLFWAKQPLRQIRERAVSLLGKGAV